MNSSLLTTNPRCISINSRLSCLSVTQPGDPPHTVEAHQYIAAIPKACSKCTCGPRLMSSNLGWVEALHLWNRYLPSDSFKIIRNHSRRIWPAANCHYIIAALSWPPLGQETDYAGFLGDGFQRRHCAICTSLDVVFCSDFQSIERYPDSGIGF